MKLEGTHEEVNVPEGRIVIRLCNTNVKELGRLYRTIDTLFNQGAFNVRNGAITLHFNDKGEMRGVDLNVSKWRDGKEVITRVALFDSAVVEIVDTSVVD